MPGVYLTDFGLARNQSASAHGSGQALSKITATGTTLGTPAYMSPEQARGDVAALTPASDVWSLGCVLYECLAGRKAFDGDTPAAQIGAVLTREPARLAGVERNAATLVAVCLQKDAGGRYQAAEALRDDCARVLGGERPLARPRRRGAAWSWAAAAAVLVVAAAVGVGLALGGVRAQPRAAPATAGGTEAARLAEQAWAMRNGDPRRAAAMLAAALADEPGRHAWRVNRGLLLWAIGKNQEACDEWGRVPEGVPERVTARLYRGLEAMFRVEGGLLRFDVAAEDLSAVAAEDGRTGRLARGALWVVRKDWAQARAALTGLPGWEAALLRGYLESVDPNGDKGAAIRAYDRGLSESIEFAWALGNRGAMRLDQGDLDGALTDFKRALELEPEDPLLVHNRGMVRARQGDLEGAIADYDRALELRPDYPDAFFGRGVALARQGHSAAALADFDRAIAHRPDDPEALFNRGLERQKHGDSAGAVADYDRAIALRPDLAGALLNRGAIRQKQGDFAAALADYDRLIAAHPDHHDALVNRGVVRTGQGEFAGAIADFDHALALRQDDPEVLYDRGNARYEQGRFPAAITDFDQALAVRPGFAKALAARGNARLRQGDLAGAVRDWEAAIAAAPADWTRRPSVEHNLARARAILAEQGR